MYNVPRYENATAQNTLSNFNFNLESCKMAKLHETLAVESALEATANKLTKESLHTLGKDSLFNGTVRKLEMFDASKKNEELEEHQELTSTVAENLDYLVKPISKYWDAVLQKDSTNQVAVAELVVDGKAIAEKVPATFLLGMETKLRELRIIYDAIPTLAPAINWLQSEQDKPGVFKAEHDTIQLKTEKDPEYRVVYEATPDHPAQIERVDRTSTTGRYITTKFSGKMSPLEKAQRIERLDNMLRAVKQARMRANNTQVVKREIGEVILNYING